MLSVVLAGLMPNVVTAAFNWVYNWQRFRYENDMTDMYDRFIEVQYWVNGIAFPMGIAVGGWAASRRFAPFAALSPATHWPPAAVFFVSGSSSPSCCWRCG